MFGMTIADIVVILIFAVLIVVCTKRGLAMSLYSAFSTLIAVVGAFLLRPLADRLLLSTGIEKFFDDAVYTQIDNFRMEHFGEAVSGTGSELAAEMRFPEFFNGFFEEKMTGWSEAAPFEQIEREMSGALASLLTSILSIVLLVILILIAMFFLKNILRIFSKIPVIRQVDRVGGFVCGLVMSMFWISLIALFFYLFSAYEGFASIQESIRNSLFAKYFYNSNLFVLLLSKL